MIMQDKISVWLNSRLFILLIVVFGALTYANSLSNEFVWDDYAVIVDNNFIKSWKNFPLIFSKKYLTPYAKTGNFYFSNFNEGSGEATYRPVVTASYFIDHAIWKLNPFGFHLTNLLLHITDAILVYLITNLIANNKGRALLCSLLFTLHPVNAEAVNMISFRDDLLAFLFFMSSLLLFIKTDKEGGGKRVFIYSASLICFSLALFSKEMAITLPFVLALYDYYFVFSQNPRNILAKFKSRYLGYALILVFYLSVRFIFMKNYNEPKIGYPGGNFYTNIITMSQVFFIYIQWLLFPINIQVILREFHLSIAHSIMDLRVLFSLSAILALLISAVRIRKKSKAASFAVLYFFVTCLPVSNMWPLINYMSSRYLYIPIFGFCFIIASSIFYLTEQIRRRNIHSGPVNILSMLAMGAPAILLIFYMTSTVIRNKTWSDNGTFLSYLIERYPRNSKIHSGLGFYFLRSGLFDKAASEFKIALSLDRSAFSHKGLGECYYLKGDLAQANNELEEAFKLDPGLSGLDQDYANLGLAFIDKGLYAEADNALQKALRLPSLSSETCYSIGNIYDRMKKYEESARAYEKSIEINPGYLQAYNNLAAVYADGGQIDKAIRLWNKAIELDPNFAIAHFNLAVFYFRQEKYDLAIQHCDKVIKLGGRVDSAFLRMLKPHRK